MNKKSAVVGVCIVLGVVLLFSTAFASSSGNAGYEVYKDALKNTVGMESFTGNLQASIKDNGELIAEINSKVKANHKDGKEAMSGTTLVKTNKTEKTMESYVQDGKAVMKASDSDTYMVYENKERKLDRRHHEDLNTGEMKDAEKVLDAMVGDLQNYFMVNTKNDGSSTVALKLEDSQIPAVVNALASMGIKGSAMEGDKMHNEFRHNAHEDFGLNLEADMPKLVEDIKVESFNLIADVSKDNKIEKQTVNATVTGKDKDGKVHKVEVQFIMSLSEVNNTTPDTIDLTGKNIKIVEPKDYENNR